MLLFHRKKNDFYKRSKEIKQKTLRFIKSKEPFRITRNLKGSSRDKSDDDQN